MICFFLFDMDMIILLIVVDYYGIKMKIIYVEAIITI